MDVIVFPEYSTQDLNKQIWTHDDMCLTTKSDVILTFKTACEANRVWGVFSIIEKNPDGSAPYNSAIIINDVDDLVHGQQQGRAGMYNDQIFEDRSFFFNSASIVYSVFSASIRLACP